MRRWGLLLLGLGGCLLTGCFIGKPMTPMAWLPRSWPTPGLDTADAVVLDVYLCEGPMADRAIDELLWAQTDDQVVPLEQKMLLEENGFRVGQVGSIAPAAVQSLLASKRACPDPRRMQQSSGKPRRLTLGPTVPWCRFQPRLDDHGEPLELEDADFGLTIVATALSDGRVQLRFTPTVDHGRAAVFPAPTLDRSAWMFQKQQPNETYQALSWELVLGANEYVIIGGRLDRVETLGFQSFIRASESPPRQRALIIRAGQVNAGPMPLDGIEADRTPPIALQAAITTFRGVAP